MRAILLTCVTLLTVRAAAQAPRVRDSAGVRIVENGPRLTAPIVFQLGDRPTFDAGGLLADPAYEFSVNNPYPYMARLAGGNVAILDYTRVLFFDPTGKRIAATGRKGSGPGEFDPATNICITRGDTVLVGQERKPMAKLTKDGAFVATVPIPAGSITERVNCFNDGSFYVQSRLGDGVYRFSRVAPNGQVTPIADHRYPPFDMLIIKENPIGAARNRVYFAMGDLFEIRAFTSDGKLADIIRTSDPLMRVTDADKEKLSPPAYRAGATPAEIEEARKAAIARSPTKFWPTVGDMRTDLSGRIWIQEWQANPDPTKPRAWAAFDSTGRLLGRLMIPGGPKEARRWVTAFGRDEVFIRRVDDDGAVHYTAYPILPVRR
jgi:hypothetical protein